MNSTFGFFCRTVFMIDSILFLKSIGSTDQKSFMPKAISTKSASSDATASPALSSPLLCRHPPEARVLIVLMPS